jgi:hypothetical protein
VQNALECHVEPVPRSLMAAFVAAHHYAVRVPPHCLLSLGCFVGTDLVSVASWGYGVRPRHTIRRLFPSLTTSDYYELNRLCMRNSEPRNGESHFLRLCREHIQTCEPGRVVLFSWADGMRGKPGYVYQADNWLYGGFIACLSESARRRVPCRCLRSRLGFQMGRLVQDVHNPAGAVNAVSLGSGDLG